MARPNLLIIIPNLGQGGAQKVFHQQMLIFGQHANVTGCVFNMVGAFPEEIASKIISLDVPAGKNAIHKAYCFIKRIVRLKKIKRSHNIGISISHLEGADYVNVLSKGKDKAILWIHGTKKHDRNISGSLGWLRKKILMKFLYRNADLIVTVSDGIKSELNSTYRELGNKMFAIRNGVDLNRIDLLKEISPSREVEDLFADGTTLITHCRLATQKNMKGLIDVVTLLKGKAIKLLILGDGELRASLIEYCAQKQLSVYSCWSNDKLIRERDVYFLGFQSNPFAFLRRATIYVMTSDWEGFPLSLCEALACALPVLSTDCFTGPREIIAPGFNGPQPVEEPTEASFGFLMPVIRSEPSVAIWSQTILRLVSDPHLREQLSARAIERIKDFDEHKFKVQCLQLLEGT